jgi:hypothetical protein
MTEMIEVEMNETEAPPAGLVESTDETDADEKPAPKKVIGKARTVADLEARRSGAGRAAPSKELGQVKIKEDATLRDIVNELGSEGSYKIVVSRSEPEQFRDPHTRQMVPVGGFLKNYYTPVDEEILQTNHGGGKFRVRFMRKNSTGSYVFFTERTITCVGDPRLDDTFRNVAPPSNAPAVERSPGENPSLANKAFDVLTSQLERAHSERHEPRYAAPGPDLSAQAAMKMFEVQLQAANNQIAELVRQLNDARNVKQVDDPWKTAMFESLVKDDSARIQAQRNQYESEIRILKENHNQDLSRQRETFDRERAELKALHLREIDLFKLTHQTIATSTQGSYETNMKIAEHENRRLERENNELKTDNKELRALKQKGPLEIVKEAAQIKEAIGGDDDGEGASKLDQVMNALPSVIEAAKTYFKPPAAQQPAQGAGDFAPKKRQIVQGNDGQKYVLETATGKLSPVKKKPPPPPQPGPNGEPPIPVIKQETLDGMINYLERAFAGNQDPEVVAQSGRAMIPEEIITAIRDHTVDGFLTKVAKLPGTSPLSNQAGKNWMRKVGKALVGE